MSELNEKKRDLRSIGRAVSKHAKSTGQSAEQTIRTAGQNVESVREATVESTRDVTARCAEVTEGVAAQSRRVMGEGIDSIRQAVPWDNVLPDDALNTLSSSLLTSKALGSAAKQKLVAQLHPAFEALPGRGMNPQAQTFATLQGLLANADLSRAINDWLQGLVAGAPTIYDRAMDATYNATHIGGGLHRMFDGSHTIPGAFQAVRDASPDDNIFQEAAGLLQALARDATTPMGLPLLNWDQDTFYGLAGTLENLGISRDWLRDMVSYDAVELVGVFHWRARDRAKLEQRGCGGLLQSGGRNGIVCRGQCKPSVASGDYRRVGKGVSHSEKVGRLEGVRRRSCQGGYMHGRRAAGDEHGGRSLCGRAADRHLCGSRRTSSDRKRERSRDRSVRDRPGE